MNDQPTATPPLVARAKAFAHRSGFAMSCDDRTGALLATLAASKPWGRLLEIGTGVGVGSAWLLSGMDAASSLHTIEIDPRGANAAGQLLNEDNRVTVVCADAAKWLAGYRGPAFDIAFVDWRVGKFQDRRLVIDHLTTGGLYVVDDLLPQPTWPTDHPSRVDRFLTEITTEADLAVTAMSWGSGLVVASRRSVPV